MRFEWGRKYAFFSHVTQFEKESMLGFPMLWIPATGRNFSAKGFKQEYRGEYVYDVRVAPNGYVAREYLAEYWQVGCRDISPNVPRVVHDLQSARATAEYFLGHAVLGDSDDDFRVIDLRYQVPQTIASDEVLTWPTDPFGLTLRALQRIVRKGNATSVCENERGGLQLVGAPTRKVPLWDGTMRGFDVIQVNKRLGSVAIPDPLIRSIGDALILQSEIRFIHQAISEVFATAPELNVVEIPDALGAFMYEDHRRVHLPEKVDVERYPGGGGVWLLLRIQPIMRCPKEYRAWLIGPKGKHINNIAARHNIDTPISVK